jgi:DNA invertase Pin-like site-specific DNA recombinase
MLIGYARISTDDQNLDLQRDALEKAGCEKIYTDQQSGASTDHLSLASALEIARSGDTLVVWRLNRLGRSLKHLIHLMEKLEQQGIGLRSLQENIDTTTSGGRLVFHR